MIILGNLSLSETLWITRKRLSLTQEELANKTGLSRNGIAMMERGEYNPTIDFLNKLCHGLNLELKVEIVPYSEIYDNTEHRGEDVR